MTAISSGILRWPDGPGWLIFSSGGDRSRSEMDEIRASALTRIMIDGGVAYVGLDDGDHDDLIDDMGDMGAPTGFFVNIMTEDDDSIRDMMQDAGMILLTGEMDVLTLRSALMGAALEGMTEAFARGAVILAEGEAMRLFGVVVQDDVNGIGWVEDSIIVPEIASISESAEVREALSSGVAKFAVSIGPDSALALGPERRIETWGEKKVTIALAGPQPE